MVNMIALARYLNFSFAAVILVSLDTDATWVAAIERKGNSESHRSQSGK